MQKRRVVSRVRDVRIWNGQRAVLDSSWLVFVYEFPACRSENGGGGGGGRGVVIVTKVQSGMKRACGGTTYRPQRFRSGANAAARKLT